MSSTGAANTRAHARLASRKTPDSVPGTMPAIPGARWACCQRFCAFRNGPKWDYCALCGHYFCEECSIISDEENGGPPDAKTREKGGEGKGGVNGGPATAVNGAGAVKTA